MVGQQRAPEQQASRVDAAPPHAPEPSFIIPGLQSRQYTEEELQLAFEMIDLDWHGTLGPTELLRTLDLCGEGSTSDAEVAEMVRLADSNGSGSVEFHEFAKFFMDPPALFRNFDLRRRDPVSALEDLKARGVSKRAFSDDSELGSSQQPTPRRVPDPRVAAIATIIGNKQLKPQYIKQLYQRFVEIDQSDNGLVSFEAFCLVFRKSQTPELRRAFDVFDVEQIGELDLRSFVISLSMFTNSQPEDKIRFAFMMYDEEQSGSLSKTELTSMLQAMAPHRPSHERGNHVARIYSAHSLHPNARVGFNEVSAYIEEHEEELVPLGREAAEG